MSEFDASVQINEESQRDQVRDQVSARLRARREQARARGLEYDALTDSGPSLFGGNEALTDLHQRVRELDAMSEEIWASLAVQDRGLPFFNRFFFGVESLFHKLVIKYVNRMAGRQLVFNKNLTGTMASLVDRLERMESNQADLQNRLRALEERLAPDQSRRTEEGKDQSP